MNDSNNIKEFFIVEDNTNIFNLGINYDIPLYQRAYAWKDKEIKQLIDDIDDCLEDKYYYIGSLIVNQKENGNFEVLDGQQRLTTLFVLLKCLSKYDEALNPKASLLYECREKSKYTFDNFSKINDNSFDLSMADEGILSAKKIIEDQLALFSEEERCSFIQKLRKVKLYRILVPKGTDKNRYFEIMNTRGEQLEQQDIVKAKLMSMLDQKDTRVVQLFGIVWDAIADMSGYVQMHFNTSLRYQIFCSDWNSLNNNWIDKCEIEKGLTEESARIEDIIKEKPRNVDYKEKDESYSFKSIIKFSFFLLHALSIFIRKKDIKGISFNENDDSSLDDKKLEKTFNTVIEEGTINDIRIKSDEMKNEFAKEFIVFLLKLRVIFDKYIIKREYLSNSNYVTDDDNDDGKWSLKQFKSTKSEKKRSQGYVNTEVPYDKDEYSYKRLLMLEACLRVSYTSPKSAHWITKVLTYAERNIESGVTLIYGKTKDFISYVENEIKAVVKNTFLNPGNYKLGVGTPHIVFNYLDYLLWEKNKDVDFNFEFRNSVEHWYPRNPSESSIKVWEDVDTFGNLCIISRRVNSKFSNLSPKSKKDTYGPFIEKGSLKLRKMSGLELDAEKWKNGECQKHEEEMLDLLQKACSNV